MTATIVQTIVQYINVECYHTPLQLLKANPKITGVTKHRGQWLLDILLTKLKQRRLRPAFHSEEILVRLYHSSRNKDVFDLAIDNHWVHVFELVLESMPGPLPLSTLVSAICQGWTPTTIGVIAKRLVPCQRLSNMMGRLSLEFVQALFESVPNATKTCGPSVVNYFICSGQLVAATEIVKTHKILGTLELVRNIGLINIKQHHMRATLFQHLDLKTKLHDGSTILEAVGNDTTLERAFKIDLVRHLILNGTSYERSNVVPCLITCKDLPLDWRILFVNTLTRSDCDMLAKHFENNMHKNTYEYGLYFLCRAFHGKQIDASISVECLTWIGRSYVAFREIIATRYGLFVAAIIYIKEKTANLQEIIKRWTRRYRCPHPTLMRECYSFWTRQPGFISYPSMNYIQNMIERNVCSWWTPNAHHLVDSSVRQRVETIMLVAHRQNTLLPKEVWIHVLCFLKNTRCNHFQHFLDMILI